MFEVPEKADCVLLESVQKTSDTAKKVVSERETDSSRRGGGANIGARGSLDEMFSAGAYLPGNVGTFNRWLRFGSLHGSEP